MCSNSGLYLCMHYKYGVRLRAHFMSFIRRTLNLKWHSPLTSKCTQAIAERLTIPLFVSCFFILNRKSQTLQVHEDVFMGIKLCIFFRNI
uniref:Uncharacterized protein n=1 Tax=Anguilla anguilla TaxID=7936 RepID=A0A0E9XVA1_ANGAN